MVGKSIELKELYHIVNFSNLVGKKDDNFTFTAFKPMMLSISLNRINNMYR